MATCLAQAITFLRLEPFNSSLARQQRARVRANVRKHEEFLSSFPMFQDTPTDMLQTLDKVHKSLQIFFASYKYFSPAQIFFTSCKYFYLYKYFYMYKYFSSGTKFFRQVCIFFRQLQIFTCVQVAYHERIQAQCQEVAGSPYIVPSTSLTCTHMTKRRPHLRLAPVKVEALSILFIVNLYLFYI